jgi:HAD superfamily hydrolase (TIGR01549 family)
MSVDAILFDIDGTLVDSNEQHVLAYEEAFALVGASFSRQAIHDQIGKGSDMLLPALMPNADEATHEQIGRDQVEIYMRKYLPHVRPFPGARDLLVRAFDAGQKLVLASSASKDCLEQYLDLLAVRDIVAATTSADDVEHTKPAPDIFAAALGKLEPIKPEQAMVVGDTPYDIQAAAKCGLGSIGVRSGKFSDEVLMNAGAVALYDDVAALLADYENSPLGR